MFLIGIYIISLVKNYLSVRRYLIVRSPSSKVDPFMCLASVDGFFRGLALSPKKELDLVGLRLQSFNMAVRRKRMTVRAVS